MNQKQFKRMRFGASQSRKILAILQEAGGSFVDMPRLSRESGSWAVHSRIAGLRKQGFSIEWKGERFEGAINSYYRLLG